MKIPTDIVTRYKIRDAKICSLYARENCTMEEIAVRFKITRNRISQILYKNRHLLKLDKEYEKTKRLNHLKRILDKKGEFCPQKDAIDVLKEIRSEINENDASVRSGETKIIIIRPSESVNQQITHESKATDGIENRIETISRSISI